MKFLFIIGVEGAGHSLVRTFFEDILEYNWIVDQGNWHTAANTLWNTHVNGFDQLRLIDRIQHGLQYGGNIKYLFDSTSFPFGQPRDTLRRPDILLYKEIIESCSIEFKPIFINRNLSDAIKSGVRRKFAGYTLQKKIIEDNYMYIKNQLKKIPYLRLDFEHVILNPQETVTVLSNYTGIQPELFKIEIKK